VLLVLAAGVVAACAGSSRGAELVRPCQKAVPGRHLELIDAHTAAINASFPDADGNVVSAAADGRGGFFIAGDFGCVGSAQIARLARLNGDGTLDTSWRPAVPVIPQSGNGPSYITAIRLVAGQLYVTGNFGVEALDARSGRRRWLTQTNANGGNGVQALAANTQRVYIGGTFTTVSGTKHAAIAMLSAQTGRPLPWAAPTLATWPAAKPAPGEPSVAALALWAGRLYLGGDGIVRVNGKKHPAIAVLNARTGRLLPWLPPFRNGLSVIGDVGTIMVAGGRVFTAGHDGFGITNALTGKADPLMAHAGGYVFAASGGTAYLAGNCRNSFNAVEGKPRNNLAQIDLATGHATPWAPDLAPYVCTDSIAASPDQVLVGGFFGSTLG
jgi:putative pyrroloquinoline-quinone binding quinoprotein